MAGVKGKSGRSNKDWVITRCIMQKLDELDPERPNIKRVDRIAEALLKEAEGGNVQALNTLLDRVEGKVAQPTENKHSIEGSLEVVKRIVKG